MKTIKYIAIIILLIVILISVVLVFCSNYFSWRKKAGYNSQLSRNIKIISLSTILGATVLLIIIAVI